MELTVEIKESTDVGGDWVGKSPVIHLRQNSGASVERKRMSVRDENRRPDIKRDVNFRMSALMLIDRYWNECSLKKKSSDREKSVLEGIRAELGDLFVREVDGRTMELWYRGLAEVKGVSPGTAVRHFVGSTGCVCWY